jgi:hypothetical protein
MKSPSKPHSPENDAEHIVSDNFLTLFSESGSVLINRFWSTESPDHSEFDSEV